MSVVEMQQVRAEPSSGRLAGVDVRWVGWAAVVLGVGLRLRWYLAGWSLWLDEVTLVESILPRGFAGLAEPLANGHNAPIPWLWAIKATTLGLGESEYALRLLPLLAAVGVLVMVWLLGRRLIGAWPAALATAVVALSYPQSVYAAQTKPYTLDALWALGLIGLAWAAMQRGGAGRLVVLGLVGVVAVWFSHPAIFTLAGVGLVLLWHVWRERRPGGEWAALLAAGGLWLAMFGLNYVLFLKLEPADQWAWLYAYWRDLGGFPRGLGDVMWLPGRVEAMVMFVVGYEWLAWFGLAGWAAGAAWLGLRRPRVLALLGLPLVLALLAGWISAYPFEGRMILFLAPSVILMIAAALPALLELAGWLGRRGGRSAARTRRAGAAVAVAGVLGPVAAIGGYWATHGRIYATEQTAPVVAEMAPHVQPGDRVILNFWARAAWWYYADQRDMLGSPVDLVHTPRNDSDVLEPIDTALARQDGRAWLVVTHYVMYWGDTADEYRKLIEKHGRVIRHIEHAGTAAFLCDFSPTIARGRGPDGGPEP